MHSRHSSFSPAAPARAQQRSRLSDSMQLQQLARMPPARALAAEEVDMLSPPLTLLTSPSAGTSSEHSQMSEEKGSEASSGFTGGGSELRSVGSGSGADAEAQLDSAAPLDAASRYVVSPLPPEPPCDYSELDEEIAALTAAVAVEAKQAEADRRAERRAEEGQQPRKRRITDLFAHLSDTATQAELPPRSSASAAASGGRRTSLPPDTIASLRRGGKRGGGRGRGASGSFSSGAGAASLNFASPALLPVTPVTAAASSPIAVDGSGSSSSGSHSGSDSESGSSGSSCDSCSDSESSTCSDPECLECGSSSVTLAVRSPASSMNRAQPLAKPAPLPVPSSSSQRGRTTIKRRQHRVIPLPSGRQGRRRGEDGGKPAVPLSEQLSKRLRSPPRRGGRGSEEASHSNGSSGNGGSSSRRYHHAGGGSLHLRRISYTRPAQSSDADGSAGSGQAGMIAVDERALAAEERSRPRSPDPEWVQDWLGHTMHEESAAQAMEGEEMKQPQQDMPPLERPGALSYMSASYVQPTRTAAPPQMPLRQTFTSAVAPVSASRTPAASSRTPAAARSSQDFTSVSSLLSQGHNFAGGGSSGAGSGRFPTPQRIRFTGSSGAPSVASRAASASAYPSSAARPARGNPYVTPLPAAVRPSPMAYGHHAPIYGTHAQGAVRVRADAGGGVTLELDDDEDDDDDTGTGAQMQWQHEQTPMQQLQASRSSQWQGGTGTRAYTYARG